MSILEEEEFMVLNSKQNVQAGGLVPNVPKFQWFQSLGG